MIVSTVDYVDSNYEIRILKKHHEEVVSYIENKTLFPCVLSFGTDQINANIHYPSENSIWISTNTRAPDNHKVRLIDFLEKIGFKHQDTIVLELLSNNLVSIVNQPISSPLNSLDFALLEKSGQDNGWERVSFKNNQFIILSSARHQAEVIIQKSKHQNNWCLSLETCLLAQEIKRSFPDIMNAQTAEISNDLKLNEFLKRLAELAYSLPNQAEKTYEEIVKKEIDQVIESKTEIERLVKQRVGQDTFRKAMLDYWEGACSVTGLKIRELLRASHAKPWADCGTDRERLDVFNGFLLVAHLDLLFDQGFISFSEDGSILISPQLKEPDQNILNLNPKMKLRWISTEHNKYLNWHNDHIYKNQ